MLPRLWLLVGSDRPRDQGTKGQTMSVIELSWTAKKEAKVIRISWQCLNAQIYSFDHLFWICCSTINLKTYWRFTSHSPNMHSLNREGCLKHAFAGALMETRLINGWAYWTWENCTIGRDRSMDKVVALQELQQQLSEGDWLIIKYLLFNPICARVEKIC